MKSLAPVITARGIRKPPIGQFYAYPPLASVQNAITHMVAYPQRSPTPNMRPIVAPEAIDKEICQQAVSQGGCLLRGRNAAFVACPM